MLTTILAEYGIRAGDAEIVPFGTGLINNTWKITDGPQEYILQRINQNVFKKPLFIAENIHAIGDYLAKKSPEYKFVRPLTTSAGEDLVYFEGDYFRLMPFIRDSRTYDVAVDPQIAREGAREFGCFTKNLAGFNAETLKVTLPDFHNLTLRYQQFETSLKSGNAERIRNSSDEIGFIKGKKDIVAVYEKITRDPRFLKRVTHHDTKISNVLFDKNDHGICVIDLDTTMSGYFISDVGDMMRTYLCPISEEEKDFSNIHVRTEYFTSIASGYLQEMSDELTESELDHFVYSGDFLIYMQAVRFLTDYFNNDIYYGSKYEGHNFNRARNQMVLLQRYQEKAPEFKKQVLDLAGSIS